MTVNNEGREEMSVHDAVVILRTVMKMSFECPCPSCAKFTECMHAGFDCARIEAWRQLRGLSKD